jgi:hypothetical protein
LRVTIISKCIWPAHEGLKIKRAVFLGGDGGVAREVNCLVFDRLELGCDVGKLLSQFYTSLVPTCWVHGNILWLNFVE